MLTDFVMFGWVLTKSSLRYTVTTGFSSSASSLGTLLFITSSNFSAEWNKHWNLYIIDNKNVLPCTCIDTNKQYQSRKFIMLITCINNNDWYSCHDHWTFDAYMYSNSNIILWFNVIFYKAQTYDAIFSVLTSCLCRTSLNLYRIESPVRYPPVFLTTAPIPEVHAVSASCFVESF